MLNEAQFVGLDHCLLLSSYFVYDRIQLMAFCSVNLCIKPPSTYTWLQVTRMFVHLLSSKFCQEHAHHPTSDHSGIERKCCIREMTNIEHFNKLMKTSRVSAMDASGPELSQGTALSHLYSVWSFCEVVPSSMKELRFSSFWSFSVFFLHMWKKDSGIKYRLIDAFTSAGVLKHSIHSHHFLQTCLILLSLGMSSKMKSRCLVLFQ